MDYSISMIDPKEATILRSYHHLPDPDRNPGFSFLSRAGHFQAGPLYRNQRTSVPGHELFFCRQGRGYFRQNGRQDTITAGQLAWIDVSHPHSHWADPDEPWEAYWLRAEGVQLNAAHALLQSHGRFCVTPSDPDQVTTSFEQIFHLFEQHRQPFDALANAEIAHLIALCVGNLFPRSSEHDNSHAELSDLLAEMRIYYHRPWRIEELARRCQKSPAQTYRLFQKTIGASPLAWLKRIRMEQAMQKLLSTHDSVSEIAYQVGYNDPLFFSRDFKKTVGMPPSKYRAHETT